MSQQDDRPQDVDLLATEDLVLEKKLFSVNRATFDYFTTVFDQPPSGEGFQNLMRAKQPWDHEA